MRSVIFLLLAKRSAVFSYHAVALLSSGIIDGNYSSSEQRGETQEMKMWKLIIVLLPFFLACNSVVFV